MAFSKAVFINLLLVIAIAKGIPTEQILKESTTSPDGDTRAKDGISRSIIAVVIGIGLTTFITVFISFYLVRGYRNLQSHVPAAVEPSETTTHEKVENVDMHVLAQENLGASFEEEITNI